MKKLTLLAALLFSLLPSVGTAQEGSEVRFGAAPGRHVLGEMVEIELVNEGTTAVTMGETWDIEYLDGNGSTFVQWTEDTLVVEPGEGRIFAWDQRINNCYGACQNVREGDPAPAGRYRVTTTIDGVERSATFVLGRYFTLEFRDIKAEEFVVFVASQPEIKEMREQTQKPVRKRRTIVSGLVRGDRRYNPNWKFTMDPNSIELGEAFIEVCDAHPSYVEKNLDEWRGERWCPWSGYVKRVGR